MPSVNERVAAARERLVAAAIPAEEATLDARLLAQYVLGWSATRLITDGPDPEPATFPERYEDVVRRRAAREPLSYITGTKEFWGLEFAVSSDVLIPRPETEFVVEAALDRIPPGGAPRVVDVCTGSGCIAIAIAHERPGARVIGVDISAPALAVARRNARRHGVSARTHWVQTDLLEALHGSFDVIVSNPPYVPETDRQLLQPEVRDFEPAGALFSGSGGLAIVNELIRQSARHLSAGGALIFEFGQGQDAAVRELISASPEFTMVSMWSDLQGIPRVGVAVRTSVNQGTER